MGGLFGHTGPSAPEIIARMNTVLAHRGRKGVEVNASNSGCIACRRSASAPAHAVDREGLVEDRRHDLALALAGFVVRGADQNRPTTGALLAAYRRDGMDFVSGLRGAFVLAIRGRRRSARRRGWRAV